MVYGLYSDILIAKGWLNDKYFTHHLKFLKDECYEKKIIVQSEN